MAGIVLAALILIVMRSTGSRKRDFFTIRFVIEPIHGRSLFLAGYQLRGLDTKVQTAYAELDLETGVIVQEEYRAWKRMGQNAAKNNYSFKVEEDFLVIAPIGGLPVRHYILDLPARAFPRSGLLVSGFHGKRGHFMRIQGQYPGGVVVREPKRFHRGGGFSDGYFILSPEGTVGAEIALPANGAVINHKVLHLTRHGILIVAQKDGRGGSILKGISGRTGKTLFRVD